MKAYGKWNIPCLTLRLTWGVSSQWVGLGGDTVYNGSSARNLIQTGTEADEVSNFPGHWYESTYAWYERVPLEPVQQIQNFTTSCGDSMYADVWQDTYGGHMYLADNTRNEYYQKDTTTNLTNGSSGEWIVERTYTSDSKPLDNFNYVVFTNCVAHENGYGTGGISSFINYDVVLLNSKGQALSNPTGLQQDSGDIGSNFRVNYVTGVSNP